MSRRALACLPEHLSPRAAPAKRDELVDKCSGSSDAWSVQFLGGLSLVPTEANDVITLFNSSSPSFLLLGFISQEVTCM